MVPGVDNGITDWCTRAFLEDALRQGLCNPHISVNSFEIEKATASGDNYLSDMYRVKVKTNENGKENFASLVMKCSPNQEFTGKYVSDLNLFEREIQALKVVLPELHRLLEQTASGKYQPFAALCLHHQNIMNTTVIVLDDLKQQGFKMAERRLGFDLKHCILVMKTLARLHGVSVGLYNKDPGFTDAFKEKPGMSDDLLDKTNEFFLGTVNSLADEIDSWSDDEECQQYSERLRKFASEGKYRLDEVTKRNDEELNVLTHGDTWVNNIMFRYDDEDQPKDVRFVDFQLSHWTSPATDLLYFLHTSLRPDLWDKQEFLLKEYHSELGDILNLFDLKYLHPTFEELLALIEKRYTYGFFASSGILPFVLRDPDNAVRVDDLLKEDQKALNKQKFHSGVELKKFYKRFLPVFAAKGVF